MITISLIDLTTQAKNRPAGYVDDVLSHAALITPTHYTLNEEAYAALVAKYRRADPQYHRGLGTLVTKGIDASSFGMAKPMATLIAKALGAKSCGCDARARCLNELVPDVSHVNTWSWLALAPKILACIGVKESD